MYTELLDLLLMNTLFLALTKTVDKHLVSFIPIAVIGKDGYDVIANPTCNLMGTE